MTSGPGESGKAQATDPAAPPATLAERDLADLLRSVAAALTAGDPPPHLRLLAQRLQAELERRGAEAPAPGDRVTTLR